MSDLWRGHEIRQVDVEDWVYADTGERVADHPDRPCGSCGRAATPEGHDGCLGALPGVVNACCGHGVAGDAYVVFTDGTDLRGADALKRMEEVARPCTRTGGDDG